MMTYFSLHSAWLFFKFVWAPLVDKLPLPLLEQLLAQRRSWLSLTEMVISAMLWMAMSDPASAMGLQYMAYAAVFLGFSSATQDIVIDAYRIDANRADSVDWRAIGSIDRCGCRKSRSGAGHDKGDCRFHGIARRGNGGHHARWCPLDDRGTRQSQRIKSLKSTDLQNFDCCLPALSLRLSLPTFGLPMALLKFETDSTLWGWELALASFSTEAIRLRPLVWLGPPVGSW